MALTACGGTHWGFPYRADLQQGNWITSDQVSQLQQGMTREQVRFILGTPTLQDIFRSNRWDYPYYNKPGYGAEEERKFTVWFEGDTLVRWEGDDQPNRQPYEKTDSGAGATGSSNDDTANDQSIETDKQPADAERRAIINIEEPVPVIPGAPVPGTSSTEPLR
ncbi:outer membrane protein assembly factor BamE [Alcaligenaceae bacterium]|nr:outer membrane protein assembly factor BamE [Alcaligenaceae bacterium]